MSDRPLADSIRPYNPAPEWAQIAQDILRQEHPISINKAAPSGMDLAVTTLEEGAAQNKDVPKRDPKDPIIPRHPGQWDNFSPVRNSRDLEKLLKEKIFADEPKKKDTTIRTKPHTTIFLPEDEAKPLKIQESESQIKEKLQQLIRDWSPKGSSNIDKELMQDVLTGEVRSWNYFDLKQDAGQNRKFY